MLSQIELLPPPPAEAEACPAGLLNLERYITQGKVVAFHADMKVCDLHILWDDLRDRADRAAAELSRFAAACEKRRGAALSHHEKHRLRLLARRANDLSECAEEIPGHLYSIAQEQFSKLIELDEDQHDAFWMDVQECPGIERT
jgi:hypothetical protein